MLGGTATSRRLSESLADRATTSRAVEASAGGARSPLVWVIDPDLLDGSKDPGELIRDHGRKGWTRAAAALAVAQGAA